MNEPIFVCEAQALAKALRDVSGLIRAKETIPILKNVLVQVVGNVATLTGSNLDCAITRTMAVEGERDGEITIELDKFRDIVSTFAAGAQCKVSSEKGWATLVCGKSRSKYGTLPATDFPPMAFDKPLSDFVVGQGFVGAVSRVKHAVSSEEARYFLRGVALRWHEGRLDVVATDGHRLAINMIDGPEISDAIIPIAGVDRFLALVGEADEIALALTDSKIRFSFGDLVLTHKLVEGTFPKYRQLWRDVSPIIATIDAIEMNDALARIMLLSDDKDRTAKLDFQPGALTIHSRGMVNEASDEMQTDHVGDVIDIALATKYVRDALASLGADHVTFGMAGPRDPVMITSPTRPDAMLLIMPKSS